MTSLTFQDNEDDCCFSSYFRTNHQAKNQDIQHRTLSQQITLKKASLLVKQQNKCKTQPKKNENKIDTKPTEIKNDGHMIQTASETKKAEMSTTRKLVTVKLNYSIDNCEIASEDSPQIAIQEVESEIYRRSQFSSKNSNFVVAQSQILHNYFDSSEYIKAVQPSNTQIKREQPKKIKRLFKTQKQ